MKGEYLMKLRNILVIGAALLLVLAWYAGAQPTGADNIAVVSSERKGGGGSNEVP